MYRVPSNHVLTYGFPNVGVICEWLRHLVSANTAPFTSIIESFVRTSFATVVLVAMCSSPCIKNFVFVQHI
jgi:hypothetical protein